MGSSKGLKVGQAVFALGNSQGLSRTLTAGVVSGLNRAVPSPVNTLTYGAIQVLVSLRTLQCEKYCMLCSMRNMSTNLTSTSLKWASSP